MGVHGSVSLRDRLDMRIACADVAKHTQQPLGYLAWHEWAEKKARTHDQHQCPTCGLWTIWRRKERT